MALCAQIITTNYNPQIVEVATILNGIHFALDSGLWPCMVKSYAEVVVNLINARSVHFLDFGGYR